MAPSSVVLSVTPSGLPVLVVAVLEVARHNDYTFVFSPLDGIDPKAPVIVLTGPDRHLATDMVQRYAGAYGVSVTLGAQ